jgi:hypothetical protein
MLSRILLATALIAAPSTFAFAQDTSPQPGDDTAGAVDMGTPPPPMAGRHGPKHRHMMRWMRHHDRNDARKGFVLSLGDGMRLRVDCGDEPLKGCIDAARPLLDQLGGGMESDMDDGMDMPPPPQITPDDAQMPPPPRVSPDGNQVPTPPSGEPGYHQEPPANPAPSGTRG